MSGYIIMIGWTTLSLDIILQLCEAWRNRIVYYISH